MEQRVAGNPGEPPPTYVGSHIDARGCDSTPASEVYTISVAWKGLQPTVAPAAAYTCGKDLYGDERLRRVISVTIRIATLT